MTTEPLPALDHVSSGCLNCGPKPIELPLDTQPHPGFGYIDLRCDGETPEWWHDYCNLGRFVYYHGKWETGTRRDGSAYEWFSGMELYERPSEDVSLQEIEECVAEDPGHDWRLVINAPLYDVTYQRQGPGKWVAVEKGLGFA